MNATWIEAIERATVLAVSPDAQSEIDGWILPFDTGTVGRARSAVPLTHATPAPLVLEEIEAAYAQRQLPVMLRIPVMAPFEDFRALLADKGYREALLTEVQIAPAATVRTVSGAGPIELLTAPNDAWASVFLGQGFDPVDGASRVEKLGRAAGSLFALVSEQERPVAAGVAAFGHGCASVHGMRTAQDCRSRGLASRVLAALAAAAMERGYEEVFLQVAAENMGAKSLYRRAGFVPAWSYSYWHQPIA